MTPHELRERLLALVGRTETVLVRFGTNGAPCAVSGRIVALHATGVVISVSKGRESFVKLDAISSVEILVRPGTEPRARRDDEGT